MSSKNKIVSVLAIVVSFAVFSVVSFAQDTTAPAKGKVEKPKGDHGMMGHRGHGKRGDRMQGLRGIELTDAQKAQIKVIRDANKRDDAITTELRTIQESKKAGATITPEQKERIKVIREQFAAKAKSVHEQILAILTPEQKAKIETQKIEMQQRFEQRKLNRKNRPAAPTTEKPKAN